MPRFPNSQADTMALADTMIAGYLANFSDFPSVVKPALNHAIMDCRTAIDEQALAKAAFTVATAAKRQALENLSELMRNYLKLSEVDTADAPENLTEIGWSPRQQPQSVGLPSQPRNLKASQQADGLLSLVWDSPVAGGTVRNYIIECSRQPDSDPPGEWLLAGTAFDNGIDLTGQPQRHKLEYRIRAVNTTGQSTPSNTVCLVL